MSGIDYYYVIERRGLKVVDLHQICVGVRRNGLNAYVRSMLAYGEFERTRIYADGFDLQDVVNYRVLSSGQYPHVLETNEELMDYIATSFAEWRIAMKAHESPKEFYAHIGYDRVKKRYVQSN